MNAETVELLKKVQGRRGEWRRWDKCIHIVFGLGIILDYLPSRMEIFFEDHGYKHLPYDDPDLLWLPPTAPRLGDDEARTLWGMVDWSTHTEDVHADGNVTIYTTRPLRAVVKQSPLPEALLRAAVGKGE